MTVRKRKKVLATCKHCKNPNGDFHKRSLCYGCYENRAIRSMYPTIAETTGKKTNQQEPTLEVYKRLQEAWSAHPLWKPSEFPRDDPRYNELVDARRAAGLPGIHAQDPKPSLD